MNDFTFGGRDPVEVQAPAKFPELVRQGYESIGERLATATRRVAPAGSSIGFQDDPSFSLDAFIKKNPAYASYRKPLVHSDPKSEEEAAWNYSMILSEQRRLDRFNTASAGSIVASMAVDPTNLLPNVKIIKAADELYQTGNALNRIAGATATGVAIEASNQALNYAGSPTYTTEKAVVATATVAAGSAVLGSAFEGVLRVGSDAFNGAYRNNRNRAVDILAMETLQENASTLVGRNKAEREFGDLSDEDVYAQITFQARKIDGIQRGLDEMNADQDAQKLMTRSDLDAQDFKRKNLIEAKEKAEKEFNELVLEKQARLVDEATVDGVLDPYKLVANSNPIPSPYRAILSYVPESFGVATSKGMDMLKKLTYETGSDFASITEGQMAGVANRGSVWTNSIVERRRFAALTNFAKDAYAEEVGASSARLMGQSAADLKARVSRSKITFAQFYNEASRKRVFQEEPSSAAEGKVMRAIDQFYEEISLKRKSVGQIGRLDQANKEIDVLKISIKELEGKLAAQRAKKPASQNEQAIEAYTKRLDDKRADLGKYEAAKKAYEKAPDRSGQAPEPYMNRVYDIPAMRNNEAGFKAIVRAKFRNEGSVLQFNQDTKTMTRKDLTGMTEQEIDDAVNKIFTRITENEELGTEGADFLDSLMSPSRQLDVTNKEMWEFIQHDIEFLTQKYVEGFAGNYHFAKMNNGKSPKQAFDEVVDQLIEDGYSADAINEFRKNFGVIEERVLRGTQLRNPARWDNRTANFLKQFTTLNYLTKSATSSISELGKIMSEHSIGDVIKGLGKTFIDPEFRKLMAQVKTEYGDALELSMGSFHQVYAEGMSRQVNTGSLWNKTLQANHILNGLGPLTEFFKTFEGALRQHTLIDYMKKTIKGEATEFESAYLNRYNISVKDMRSILDRAPMAQNGTFNIANIDQWEVAGVAPDSIQKFRAAMQSGISNVIVSATPADKPIFVDGVMLMKKSSLRYVPWARNLPEDSKYTGYVRVESGLGTLPFQFQSVTMAGMNKTLGAYTSGMVRNRYTGIMAGMMLGYVSLWAKTPDYIWDEMSESSKFARAFDYASLAPLYTTLIYDSMAVSGSLGQDSIFEQVIDPKFDEPRSATGFATSFLGPASSSAMDALAFGRNVIGGDISQAALELYRLTPLIDTLGVRMITNQIGDIVK